MLLSVKKQKTLIEKTTYEMKCDVFNAAPIQNLTIEWYKNNEILIVASFPETVKTPMNKSSILEMDVNREENDVRFRCEAHLKFDEEPEDLIVAQTVILSHGLYLFILTSPFQNDQIWCSSLSDD